MAVGGLVGVALAIYAGIKNVREMQTVSTANNGIATWKWGLRLGAIMLFGLGALILVIGCWYPAVRESIPWLLKIAYALCLPAVLVAAYHSLTVLRTRNNDLKPLRLITLIFSSVLFVLLVYLIFFSL